MELYLSSYKMGNEENVSRLVEMLPTNKRTAYISNALDFSTDEERRRQSEDSDIASLESVGLEVKRLNLRDYFNQPEELQTALSEFGVIWVRGGNVFVLRQAMKLSGLDAYLREAKEENLDLLYGGYSAGVCVLAPSLKGLDLIDDPNIFPYGVDEVIYEGIDLLDYTPVPHFESDHPEAESAKKTAEFLGKQGVKYKTMHDGEVIIVKY